MRAQAIDWIQKNDPANDPIDTNYILLSFVLHYLPVGMIRLILAVIFPASISSTAFELNALASTTVMDIYKRLVQKESSERHSLLVSKIATFL